MTLGSGSSAWSNAGTINATGSTVNLAGSFTQAGLGTFNRSGGTVNITGTLSGNLTLNAATGTWNLAGGGTILDGTINDGTVSGGAVILTSSGGVLNGVTLTGELEMSQVQGSTLAVQNGLSLDGTIELGSVDSSVAASLIFKGTQTLSGTGTLQLGGSVNNTIEIEATGTSRSGDALHHRQRRHDCGGQRRTHRREWHVREPGNDREHHGWDDNRGCAG